VATHLDAILAELKRARGLDFSGYRRGMLERRLALCMVKAGCTNSLEYLELLRKNPAECDRFIRAVAINVSAFFRNPIVFEILAQTILPDIVEHKRRAGHRELRVWSAGCAEGEEVYSAAILIHQALRDESGDWAVHVFATDIDASLLQRAAEGVYPRARCENTKLGLLDAYFTARGDGFEVQPFIRDMVSFSQDDLTSPKRMAPAESVFGTFDLVLCRNVLIYFMRGLQDTVFARLYGSLATGGYLILGEAEALSPEMASPFETVDRKNRIYRKSG